MHTKPLTQLEDIRSRLVDVGDKFFMPADSELNMKNENNESLIWFFNKGSLFLHREIDDFLMDLISAPTLIGLANIFHETQVSYRLVAQTDCTGFTLPANLAFDVIEKNKLWQQTSHWTTYLIRSLEYRDARYSGATTYSQIRATLLTMDSWDSELRTRTGVINFVQKRTKISRSVIAEILAALRKGNYIEMSKGKLIAVKHLPQNY